jgi:hypothetical protein
MNGERYAPPNTRLNRWQPPAGEALHEPLRGCRGLLAGSACAALLAAFVVVVVFLFLLWQVAQWRMSG